MGAAVDDESEPLRLHTEEMRINMGPQHPSTHGVLRLMLTLDGEIVQDVVPYVGYLHRASEKLAETSSDDPSSLHPVPFVGVNARRTIHS